MAFNRVARPRIAGITSRPGVRRNYLPLLSVLLAGCIAACHIIPIESASVRADGDTGYWSIARGEMADSRGATVHIAGINWFGMETHTFAPHGLWARGYRDLLNQIKSLGFNTIRLPFSNKSLESGRRPAGIDYSLNPDLRGLTGLQVMDKLIQHATRLGLRVLLDRHCTDSDSQLALWYSSAYPESRWIADWQMLARHYRSNPAVIGADLHNEPHGAACWGCGDPAVDWRLAAERAGNSILSVNPNWLIFVQGVETYRGDRYWRGGNLMGVRHAPVRLSIGNRVVYSAHDYPASVYGQRWFSDPRYPDNLPALWDAHWGNIQKSGIAPVLVGEFGTRLEQTSDQAWLDTLVQYLRSNKFGWAFWCLNPNSSDTGGLLMEDWRTVIQSKQTRLATIQFAPPQAVSPAR